MSTSQDKLNTWVMKRPWAAALIGVVFIVMAIGLWVSEDPTGRYATDSIWVDYIVAPLGFLLGLFTVIVAAVRTVRGGGRTTTS